MTKITNDGLARSGTGCLIASCTHMAKVGVEGSVVGLVIVKCDMLYLYSCLGDVQGSCQLVTLTLVRVVSSTAERRLEVVELTSCVERPASTALRVMFYVRVCPRRGVMLAGQAGVLHAVFLLTARL